MMMTENAEKEACMFEVEHLSIYHKASFEDCLMKAVTSGLEVEYLHDNSFGNTAPVSMLGFPSNSTSTC